MRAPRTRAQGTRDWFHAPPPQDDPRAGDTGSEPDQRASLVDDLETSPTYRGARTEPAFLAVIEELRGG